MQVVSSAIVAEFMIRNDMKFSGDRELFFITAGLMKSETGARGHYNCLPK